MRLLPRHPGEQPQERQRQHQPPEADGHRADVAKPDQPRSERQSDIAEQKRRKGERMGMRTIDQPTPSPRN
jgi:hypothetical protein